MNTICPALFMPHTVEAMKRNPLSSVYKYNKSQWCDVGNNGDTSIMS